jgi:small subunit ribosomal protein S18
VCAFCVDKIKEVDYKDLTRLRRFLSERGKIEPRRKTGTCAAHQRSLNIALKRARELALLPFTAEHIRITGVLVREPGAPPYRGARTPRPTETDGEAAPAAAEAPAQPAAEAPASTAAATTDGSTPTSDSPAAVAASSAVEGVRETPASGPQAQES